MKQQMLERQLMSVHVVLKDLAHHARMMVEGSQNLDPDEMVRALRRAQIVVRKNDLETAILVMEASINTLLSRYGHGVRPSWVSAEISMERNRQDMYRQEILKLEEEMES